MSYKIKLNKSTNIVDVVYTHTVSLPDRMKAVDEVCEKFSHLDPIKIQVDVRELVMDLSFEEQEKFGLHLANHNGLKNARVAVLHKPDFNANIVVDSIAFANGYLLAQFSSPSDAKEWLIKK